MVYRPSKDRRRLADTATSVLARRIESQTVVVAAVAALFTSICSIGADARWLAALGARIAHDGSIPDGVPFAVAPSSGWHNVPVLAELVFHWLVSLGDDLGLQAAQAAAVAAGLGIMARDAAKKASSLAVSLVVVLVAVGGIAAFAVVRVQLFSLVLFPLLALLLRADARMPGRRIWLLPALIAVWTNLHGAVLLGVAVAGAYLLVARLRYRPFETVAVGIVSLAALYATPALTGTDDYYRSVLENEAAQQHVGLWARIGTGGLDLLLVAAAAALVVLALRARPRTWELVAIAGLVAATVQSSRSGIWLLLFAAVPAARGLPVSREVRRMPALMLAVPLLLALAGLARGPLPLDASDELVARAVRLSQGAPILADPVPAEQIVLAGGRIWLGNPLDAFARRDQRLYLAWVEGEQEGDAALARARIVVVMRHSDAAKRLAKLRTHVRLASDDQALVYGRG